MSQLKKTFTFTPEEFAERIRNITTDLLAVAADLVHSLPSRPKLAREIAALGINPELVKRLEKLGRKQLHPDLVLATTPGAIKLGSCVPSEQELLLESGAEVMEGDDSRVIPIHELTDDQARQVFVNGHVRTLAEQRSWLKSAAAKKVPADFVGGYSVHRDFVVIKEPMRLPKKLVLQFLVEMS
jgi:hypothetical protein